MITLSINCSQIILRGNYLLGLKVSSLKYDKLILAKLTEMINSLNLIK